MASSGDTCIVEAACVPIVGTVSSSRKPSRLHSPASLIPSSLLRETRDDEDTALNGSSRPVGRALTVSVDAIATLGVGLTSSVGTEINSVGPGDINLIIDFGLFSFVIIRG